MNIITDLLKLIAAVVILAVTFVVVAGVALVSYAGVGLFLLGCAGILASRGDLFDREDA